MTRPLPILGRLLWPTPAPAAAGRRPPSRKRARAAVLTGLGCFLALQAGMNVALDTVRPEWRDPEYGHRLKDLGRQLRFEARSGSARPLVIALGSSRTEMGLSPRHLGLGDGPGTPLVYNFSQSGCGPDGQVLNLRRLLATGVRPAYLLVEVVPPLLADDRPAEARIAPDRLAAADLARVRPYCGDYPAVRAAWVRGRVAPWWTDRRWLVNHWAADTLVPAADRRDFLWTEMRPGGWMPFYKPDLPAADRAGRTATARREYAPRLAGFAAAAVPDRAYRDLSDLCRANGIRAAFYVMPESPTFRGWYPPGVRGRANAYLAGLAGVIGAPVFDASGWFDDEALFSDGHHLLGHGAEAFSRRFGTECVGPWVTGANP